MFIQEFFSLRCIRLVLFVAELNQLDSWWTDIGNAYLEAFTKEKFCINARREFGPLEGHTLIINKALCRARASGLRWHERLSDFLRDMCYEPCKIKPDFCLRDCGEHYDHIDVYVDDLLIASKDPQSTVDTLTNKHNFKLKGTGPMS